MKFPNGGNYSVRASILDLDPALYDAIDAGDELVLYTPGVLLLPDDEIDQATFIAAAGAKALVDALEHRGFDFECYDVSYTRIVWRIVLAKPILRAADAAE